MKFLEGLRDPSVARGLIQGIRRQAAGLDRQVRIMEVCGTHTVSLRKHGIHTALPPNITLISGPGCPVCVTPAGYIDNALELAEGHGAIIATFGDMLKVPGTTGRALSELLRDRRVRMVYSPSEVPPMARETSAPVVFLGIGFETTIPPIMQVFRTAREEGVSNMLVYTSFRRVVPALNALLADPDSRIDGFLLPGHVSVIIGARAYEGLISPHGAVPAVIAGFEPVDMLGAIYELVHQMVRGEVEVVNGYPRAVRPNGNERAQHLIKETLEPCDSLWRGLGSIPDSGWRLQPEYRDLDARLRFGLEEVEDSDPPGCLCSRVIQGKALPPECGFFAKGCTPEDPLGPCMVSSEGTCAAHFRYCRDLP